MNVDEGRGRLVVVVGGANGIGAATARALHARGWRLAIADLDRAAAQRLAGELSGFPIEVDVLDEHSVAAAADAIDGASGGVYGLVNSAAAFQPRVPVESVSMRDWDRIVMSSHRGTYVCIVEFARRMAARGAGAIVNVSSMVGHQPHHAHAYCSAKAAVHALTVSMAAEWGRSNIRVNSVSPGFTAVPRVLQQIVEGKRYAINPAEVSALGRLVTPEEVAQPIAFLLSDGASAITGADLLVDAGVLASSGWAANGGVPKPRQLA